jgi:hypothetical protein
MVAEAGFELCTISERLVCGGIEVIDLAVRSATCSTNIATFLNQPLWENRKKSDLELKSTLLIPLPKKETFSPRMATSSESIGDICFKNAPVCRQVVSERQGLVARGQLVGESPYRIKEDPRSSKEEESEARCVPDQQISVLEIAGGEAHWNEKKLGWG